jgi:uncharacterized protein
MSADVYFSPLEPGATTEQVQQISKRLLETVVEKENIALETTVPLKVHFGEPKNVTFIRPENYHGIIDYLREHNIGSAFMETCALYGGERCKKELHEKTAEKHGFTELPIIFADGEHGEDFVEVPIDKNHFQTFKVGKAFLDYKQLIVLSHFKGHILAGFGGAIKQLSMGYASKGGKLAMHMGEKPHIISRKCTACKQCLTGCNQDALIIEKKKSRIDKDKCVGCGACVAICTSGAISLFSIKSLAKFIGIGNPFIEKLVEGAYAAQKHQQNIYVSFAMSITKSCDCIAKPMKPVMDDIGVFAATDPVAIDKACFDIAESRGRKFRGNKTFAYAERIGLGTTDYTLHEIPWGAS